jgi:hypothetical protein
MSLLSFIKIGSHIVGKINTISIDYKFKNLEIKKLIIYLILKNQRSMQIF